MSHAKTAKLIEMPFGLCAWVGSRNHELDMGPDLAMESGNFGRKGRPIVKYRDAVQ